MISAAAGESVGQALPRAAARRFASGRGRYLDDLRLPGLLHVAFLRSPLAACRFRVLDTQGALASPGVHAVLTAADLAGLCDHWTTSLRTLPEQRSAPQGPLAQERAFWQGQPVALVVAESRAMAEDGVAALEVDWEELEPQVDARAALAAGATPVHPSLGSNLMYSQSVDFGDWEAVAAGAHRVVRAPFVFSRHTGVPLEGRGVIAEFDPATRHLTVHQSTQVPQQMRAVMAKLLSLRETDVRVVTPDVGGAFGIKLHVYDDEMAVVAAAMRLRRPLKFLCDRAEAFNSDVHARAHRIEAEVAIDANGRLLGFRIEDLMEAGAHSVHPRTSVLEGVQAMTMVGAAYRANALRGHLQVACLNKVPVGAYRGVGQPLACAVTEGLVDLAARELGLDPVTIRRLNFRVAARDGGRSVNGIDYGALSHEACLDRLLQRMDYTALRQQQAQARLRGRHLGIGLASFVEVTAPGPGFYGAAGAPITAQDGCVLRLEPDGGVSALVSCTDQGQGVDTVLQQVIAQALTVSVDAVRILRGDTLAVPAGGGTWASRGIVVGGEAALRAAAALRDQLATVAAAVLGVEVSCLQLLNGRFEVVGSPSAAMRESRDTAQNGSPAASPAAAAIALSDLARMLHYGLHELPPGCQPASASVAYAVPSTPFLAANGVQASLVEVDADTGIVRVLRHWVVEDCGRVLNPLLADEQIRGGVVQGLGGALFEECLHDESGQHLTSTLADYLVPMAFEMPDIVVDHVHTPVPGTLLGAKGLGEAGTIGAVAALGNAVNDALAPLGVRLDRQPYTPMRVLRALGRIG